MKAKTLSSTCSAKLLFIRLFSIALATVLGPSVTFALGVTDPYGWHATKAEATATYHMEDYQIGVGTSASVDMTVPSTVNVSLLANPYHLSGYAQTGEDVFLIYQALFRDEVYFESDDGLPGEIVFNFDFDIDIFGDSSFVFQISLTTTNDGNLYDINASRLDTLRFEESTHSTISLSTLGDEPGSGLVDSGTYFPFSIVVTSVVGSNTTHDWSNSLILENADVYRWDGNTKMLLDPDDYTLASPDLDKATTPIPESATLFLLGSGLIVTIGFINRKSCFFKSGVRK